MKETATVKSFIARNDDILYASFFEKPELRKILNKKRKWYSVKDLVILHILSELKKFGIKKTKDEIEYELLTTVSENNWKEYKKDLHHLEYYICRVFMKENVNIYILPDWVIDFATVDEFSMSQILFPISSYITISLNSIIAEIYWRNDLRCVSDVQVTNSLDEMIILNEIKKASEKLDVIVSFKNNKDLEKIAVTRKLTEEEKNDINWTAKKSQFWKLKDVKFHRWKIDWKITETKYRKNSK